MQRGAFGATLCTVELQGLAMQRLSEELSRVSHVGCRGGRDFIVFRTEAGAPVIRNGVELTTTSITRLRPGQSYYQHTAGPTSHAGISLPLDEVDSVCTNVAGCSLRPLKDDVTVTPPPDAMARLQRLSKVAGDLAENAPEVLAHPEAARGLEQAIIGAIADCLGGDVDEDRAARRQHTAIMRRFHQVIERFGEQPIYIPELCREIGASERTLRDCCQEQLGMGPKHYLLLRRLHLVRRALRSNSPADTTVTKVATQYGFWQFGRFASEYKAHFNELPSTTLAQPAKH
jgi:AraC-like DNA-binding protein